MNKSLKRHDVFSTGTKVFLSLFFAIAVVFPLIKMLLNLEGVDFGKIITADITKTAIRNSLLVSLCATAIAIAIAGAAAYFITRVKIKLKGLYNICLLLPMLIPSISHGMGFIIIFGSNGSLTRLFGLESGVYGFWGIVIGSVMYAFPVAYLMIADILKYEDATPYEAASVLGIPKMRRFTSITLPYLRKPMISVVFATFTMIVTDYGVPKMVGGMYKTIPVLLYEDVIEQQNFAKGSVYGVVLLIPAVAAFLVDMLCKNNRRNSSVSKDISPSEGKTKRILSYTYLTALSVCVIYPIWSFVRLAFSKNFPIDKTFTLKHIEDTLRMRADEFLINSVVIAVLVSVVGVLASFICAYLTSRTPGKVTKLLHLMSIISLAIPGIVLGLSYVLAFSGSFLYGTLAILVLANTVHFFSSPYLMIYNSMGKLNPNLEAVSSALGIGKVRLICDVIIPQTRTTLLEMFSYFFVNSMMTISAVSFLATIDTKPLSLMITQSQGQLLLERSAFVSLVIFAVNLIMKGIVHILRVYAFKKNKNHGAA